MRTFNRTIVSLVFVLTLSLGSLARFSPRSVIDELNAEFQLSLNVLLNFNNKNLSEEYQHVLATTSKPLIIYNDADVQVQSIYLQQTKNLLVIAWVDGAATMNYTIKFLDRLLWKLHWMEILFVVEQDIDERKLFEICWSKGFTNVLLYNHHGQLSTYHPYPELQIKQLAAVKVHKNKNHLKNLQGHKIFVPFRQRPPHCFKYWNRKGELVLAGYWYKLIDIFIKHCNATIASSMVSVEETRTPQDVLKFVQTRTFDFIPTVMYFDNDYSNSNVFSLSKVVVICAVPAEISKSLYMFKAFHAEIWLLYTVTFLTLWLLIIFIYKFKKDIWDLMGCYMDVLNIMTHQSSRRTKGRSILMFILHFLPFLTGFLLTNFYNCNLSSMLTAKIYEQPYLSLSDLTTADQMILESMNDIRHTLSLASVPDYIKKRIVSIESKQEYYRLRRNLMVDKYFFTGPDDFTDFFLFQQLYLTRPLAKSLEQALYTRPYFFAMPHRSPHLQNFNNYLMYIQENGLYNKYQHDAKWDGIISKEISFFAAQKVDNALDLVYFYDAFNMISIGLMCSLLVFAFEINLPLQCATFLKQCRY